MLVDSEPLALDVELEVLAELGLSFDRDDYVLRFMGLSTEAFHAAMDAEAQQRLGRAISAEVRGSGRLRDVMVAHLTEVPGATEAVTALRLPKAIASSGSRRGLERKLRQTGLWDHFAPHVYSADHVASAAGPTCSCMRGGAGGRRDCLVLRTASMVWRSAGGGHGVGFLGGGHAHGRLGARRSAGPSGW